MLGVGFGDYLASLIHHQDSDGMGTGRCARTTRRMEVNVERPFLARQQFQAA